MSWRERDDIDEEVASSLGMNRTDHQARVSAPPQIQRQTTGTVWLTGLSGSGKSTIAFEMARQLVSKGYGCYVLDGDILRRGLNRDLGFSPKDRAENVRRTAEVCKLFNDAGLFVMAAFISPYREDRECCRKIIGPEAFLETYLSAPLDVCERRDPKGLYARARAGEIREFTGVSAPYEPPARPNITLDTAALSVRECVDRLLDALSTRLRAAGP
jgi:adenylyl-sulfate kinase